MGETTEWKPLELPEPLEPREQQKPQDKKLNPEHTPKQKVEESGKKKKNERKEPEHPNPKEENEK